MKALRVRYRYAMRIILLLLVAASCGKSPVAERCERGVTKVFDLTMHAGGGKPGAEEQSVIDSIQRQTIGACEAEGLSTEQLDCLLAMKTFDDMRTVTLCPAIKAKRPGWLIAGAPQP